MDGHKLSRVGFEVPKMTSERHVKSRTVALTTDNPLFPEDYSGENLRYPDQVCQQIADWGMYLISISSDGVVVSQRILHSLIIFPRITSNSSVFASTKMNAEIGLHTEARHTQTVREKAIALENIFLPLLCLSGNFSPSEFRNTKNGGFRNTH